MAKILLMVLSILLISSLVGCNLPSSAPVEPNELATQVSNLLTSTPLVQASPFNGSTDETLVEPVEQETPIQASQVTETIDPTAETTIVPTDLPLELPEGTPNWSDPFDDGTRFGINPEGYDDGQTKINITDGSMVLTSITGTGWRGWRLTSQKPVDYFLKADFSTLECSGSDQYGLVIQSPDYTSGLGYYFGLTCDGRFAFQRWEEGGLSNLVGWDTNLNINTGSNQNNTIGILKSGNIYNLYINNVKITEVEDQKYAAPGYFGPFIAGVNTVNFTVNLTNISYWNIP